MEEVVTRYHRNCLRGLFRRTKNGYNSVDAINGALQLYKARRVKKFVRQETDRFSETFRMSSNLKIIPEK